MLFLVLAAVPAGSTTAAEPAEGRPPAGEFAAARSGVEPLAYIEVPCVDRLLDTGRTVDLYYEHAPLFREQLARCARHHGPLVELDLRDEETIYAGNRFMIYALNPSANISMHVMWGRARQNTVFAIGKSIVNRSSPVNVGQLCLAHGGGGHRAAGTCQVDTPAAESARAELISRIVAWPSDSLVPQSAAASA